MKRILVIRGGAIGDFILTLPAIKLLRDAYPQSHLEILGYKHIVALAQNRFYAQAVRSIEYSALASFFARNAELPNELCDYFKNFDLVVSYLFDPDRIFEQNLDRAGVDLFLACSPKISPGEHAARQLATPLEQLDLERTDESARLFPAPEDRQFAENFLQTLPKPIVALHPGSGSASKNWPIENWLRLSEWLLEGRAGSLVIVSGEADQEQVAVLGSVLRGDRVRRADNLPLHLLGAVLEGCDFFIGHDSGISHIAAAVGTPCCLLFGPTDPRTWAPTGKNVRVLKAPTEALASLSLETATEFVKRELGRSCEITN